MEPRQIYAILMQIDEEATDSLKRTLQNAVEAAAEVSEHEEIPIYLEYNEDDSVNIFAGEPKLRAITSRSYVQIWGVSKQTNEQDSDAGHDEWEKMAEYYNSQLGD